MPLCFRGVNAVPSYTEMLSDASRGPSAWLCKLRRCGWAPRGREVCRSAEGPQHSKHLQATLASCVEACEALLANLCPSEAPQNLVALRNVHGKLTPCAEHFDIQLWKDGLAQSG